MFTHLYSFKSFRIRSLIILLVFALFVAIISEFKVYPFNSEVFRFSLAPILFVYILLMTQIKQISFSIFTALSIVSIRMTIGILETEHNVLMLILSNIPAAIFYLILGLLIIQTKLQNYNKRPILLFFLLALFEIISNMFELVFMALLLQQTFITASQIVLVFLVACIRSFFVTAIITAIGFYEGKDKIQTLLHIHSQLYTDALYMKQTMVRTEQLTNDQFQLYKQLQQSDHPLAYEALRISTQMHEVKKNAHRISASLSNLYSDKNEAPSKLQDLIHIVYLSQTKYASYLQKEITITYNCRSSYPVTSYLALLSLLNNIVSNAVEAIPHIGTINIEIQEREDLIYFTISNSGPLIPAQQLPIIFDIGYTTKFHANGEPSTGIGLYHVQALVEQLDGSIEVVSTEQTIFKISLTKAKL
jgi:signal transduction histidine kinase